MTQAGECSALRVVMETSFGSGSVGRTSRARRSFAGRLALEAGQHVGAARARPRAEAAVLEAPRNAIGVGLGVEPGQRRVLGFGLGLLLPEPRQGLLGVPERAPVGARPAHGRAEPP